MSITQKLLLPIIKRKIKKEAEKWYEETENWTLSDWKTYQANRFDELKMNPWTSEVFPDLKNIEYEELPQYPITEEWPTYPEGFPAARTIYSTGTVKRKVIKFTKDDMLSLGSKLATNTLRTFGLDPNYQNKHFLTLIGGQSFMSGTMAFLFSLYIKRTTRLNPLEIKDYMTKLTKEHFDGILGIQAFIITFLEELDKNIFNEEVWIGNSADIMTASFVKFVNERLESFGVQKTVFIDIYGSSEGFLMGASLDALLGDFNLVAVPDFDIMVLEKFNGDRINILNANKGDVGRLYVTPMVSLMVPNFKLGDIVEVVGTSRRFGLPEIKVLGRETYRVRLNVPGLGEIEGYSGSMVKILGIPFNIPAFDKLISKFTKNYLLLVKREGNKALFELYIENPLSKKILEEAMKYSYELNPIYAGLETNRIDIELKKMNFKYKQLVQHNLREGQLKLPRVILDYRVTGPPQVALS